MDRRLTISRENSGVDSRSTRWTGLTRIVGSRNAGGADQVEAAWNLARWTAASGDWKTCLLYLGKIADLDKTFYRARLTRILVVEANLRTGNFDKAIEYAEYRLARVTRRQQYLRDIQRAFSQGADIWRRS